MIDRLAKRYGVLPTELLVLSPADLGLVLRCEEAGRAHERRRRGEALGNKIQPVVVVA